MSNTAVTIGGTDAATFAEWLSWYGFTGGASIVDSIGFWNGTQEPSVSVTFWDLTPHFASTLLEEYGKDHPDEQFFGILESTFSKLVENPSYIDQSLRNVEPPTDDQWNEFLRGL